MVVLTAVPGTDSGLGGWSGACSGSSATCNVSMTAARNVTVTFNVTSSPPGGNGGGGGGGSVDRVSLLGLILLLAAILRMQQQRQVPAALRRFEPPATMKPWGARP
jgi:hypothetical protein